jgi:aminoglycoside 3-N-acetyltransferase
MLRTKYHAARSRLEPALRFIYGTFDTDCLRQHLEQRVGKDFEILMVHSSINHMKPMYTDGPLDLLRMLIDYVGPNRTLAMPAFYFGDPKYGSTRETLKNRPRFDIRRTPSQMGLLTEMFRRYEGVKPSRNPVYRVCALGPLAADLVKGHEFTESPSGPGSPFDFMANHDTLVVGIGKPYEVLTQIHHGEEVMGDEFPVPRGPGDPLPITLVDGPEEIPFVLRGRTLQWQLNMWKLRNIMNRDELKDWRFHHVPLFSARAKDVTDSIVTAARRGVTLYEPPKH